MGLCNFLIKFQHLLKISKVLLLIWVFVCFSTGFVMGFGSDLDKSALLEFKAQVSDSSGVLGTWGGKARFDDHCSWLGVACDSSSRVVALNLTGGNLGASSSSSSSSCVKIGHFPLYGFGVRRICLSQKVQISGKLPSVIAKLSELKVLSLPFNELSGEIPVEIWSMEKLDVLDLEMTGLGWFQVEEMVVWGGKDGGCRR